MVILKNIYKNGTFCQFFANSQILKKEFLPPPLPNPGYVPVE